jgi:hypothetical protein
MDLDDWKGPDRKGREEAAKGAKIAKLSLRLLSAFAVKAFHADSSIILNRTT